MAPQYDPWSKAKIKHYDPLTQLEEKLIMDAHEAKMQQDKMELEAKVRAGDKTEWLKGQEVYYTTSDGWTIICKILEADYFKKRCILESVEDKSKRFPMGSRIDISFRDMNERCTLKTQSDVQIVVKDKIVEKEVIKEVVVEKEVEKIVEKQIVKEIRTTHLKAPDDTETLIDRLYNWYWYTWKKRDDKSVTFKSDI